MQFKIITKEEFLNYRDNFNYNFYQNPSWSEVKKKNGWNSFYTAVFDEKNKPILLSLVLAKKILNKYLYYAPRGPLLKNDVDRKKSLSILLARNEELFKK